MLLIIEPMPIGSWYHRSCLLFMGFYPPEATTLPTCNQVKDIAVMSILSRHPKNGFAISQQRIENVPPDLDV